MMRVNIIILEFLIQELYHDNTTARTTENAYTSFHKNVFLD